MTTALEMAKNRFLATLEIVRREINVLNYSSGRLFSFTIDKAWAERLRDDMQAAEILEAYVSRFGRLQDTIGDKLIPRALSALVEKTGSMLDNLNRAERLGWLDSVDAWVATRELRNKLVHEYIKNAEYFAMDVKSAHQAEIMLKSVYIQLSGVALSRFNVTESGLASYYGDGVE
ncbi:MAG: hypothetical protein AABY83_11035 [Pseudomonadota bacterium]